MTSRTTKPRPYGEFFEPVPTTGGSLLQARRARFDLSARDAWVAELFRLLCRNLVADHGPMVAQEIASAEVVRVLEQWETIITTWTPERYARQRVNGRRAFVDHWRREGAQRGEGARHQRKVLATAAAGRVEQDSDGQQVRPLEEYLADPTDQYAHAGTASRIELALRALSPEHREIVELVELRGLEVTEAAAIIGIRRETASRRLSRALKILQPLLVDLVVDADVD